MIRIYNSSDEFFEIKVDDYLQKRWLGEGSLYRNLLIENGFDKHIDAIRRILKLLNGKNLPQSIKHQIISGKFIIN